MVSCPFTPLVYNYQHLIMIFLVNDMAKGENKISPSPVDPSFITNHSYTDLPLFSVRRVYIHKIYKIPRSVTFKLLSRED